MPGFFIFGVVVSRMSPGNFWMVAVHIPFVGFAVEFPGRTTWREHGNSTYSK